MNHLSRTLRVTALFWLAGALLLGERCRGEESVRFHVARQIELPEIDGHELIAVRLDEGLFAVTRDGFPDVRLLEQDRVAATEVAHLIRRAVTLGTRTVRDRGVVDDIEAHPIGDSGLQITFMLDPEQHPRRPAELRLVSPLRNFEHRVEVAVSTDGETWQPLVNDALVFDYSQFLDVRNDGVRLPWSQPVSTRSDSGAENFPRYFRLQIDEVTQEQQSQLIELTHTLQGGGQSERSERTVIRRQPFRIDRIETISEVERPRIESMVRSEYPLLDLRVDQDASGRRTLVTVRSNGAPLTGLQLETPNTNFSRRVVVETRDATADSGAWRTLASGTLSRIALRDLQRSNVTLALPESRQRHYRLTIDNGDSPPLKVDAVTARGPVYELVFLAKPGAAYQLAYGHPTVKAARYDTAALELAIAEGLEPLTATLGEQEPAPEIAVPQVSLLSRLINDTRVLLGLIGALAVILAWALFRAARAVDAAS